MAGSNQAEDGQGYELYGERTHENQLLFMRWTQAWLANRQSWVAFENAKSKKTIHQGTIRSPLLFLFYIDDLHRDSGELHVSHFADDMAIWALDSKFHMTETRQQEGLDAVTTWSKDRKMLPSAQVASSRQTRTNLSGNQVSL